MSFRVRPELKNLMDAAAAESGRSVTQEIEIRLEQSFRDDQLAARLEAVENLLGELMAKLPDAR